MKSNKIYTKTILGLFTVSLFCLLNLGCVFGQIGRTQDRNPPAKDDYSAPKSARTQEKTLIGRWKSSEAIVEIRPNGKMTINGDLFDYEVSGSTITVSNDEGSLDFPFRLSGDTLTVTAEGRKIVYQRMNSGGDDDDSDNERAETPRNRGSGGGNAPQELVGKWCYLASFTANNGGGRQSETCFVLNPNGTYVYHAETSNSNPYGGSNSRTDDSGRWSATADTLTAYSNSGETKTYTLEKRNHPKTGDPMLIVDGDAFVTFYQRNPW